MKILLVYDVEGWVLNGIANSISEVLSSKNAGMVVDVLGLASEQKGFYKKVANFDVVHYLSPQLVTLVPFATLPTVANINHHQDDTESVIRSINPIVDVYCLPNQFEMQWLSDNETFIEKRPYYMLPYGLDTKSIKRSIDGKAKIKERLNICRDSLLIGLAARKKPNLNDRKGIDRLWEFCRMAKHSNKFPIDIILFGPASDTHGDVGWDRLDIPADIRDIVYLPGYTENLPDYSGLDYYLCFSRYEGGPYPALEAMSQEVVVISTPVGTIRDVVINDFNGYVVPHEDCFVEAHRIIEHLENNIEKNKKIREQARKTMTIKRDWQEIVIAEWYEYIYLKAQSEYAKRSVMEPTIKSFRSMRSAMRSKARGCKRFMAQTYHFVKNR